MAWEDQGRQEHGWFGHGRAPLHDPAQRALAQELRGRAWAAFEFAREAFVQDRQDSHRLTNGMRDRLAALVPRWADAAQMAPNQFRRTQFGEDADPLEAWGMQHVTRMLCLADNDAALKATGQVLAGVLAGIGPANLPAFLANAEARLPKQAHPALLHLAAETPGDEEPGSTEEKGDKEEERLLSPHLGVPGRAPSGEDPPEVPSIMPRFGTFGPPDEGGRSPAGPRPAPGPLGTAPAIPSPRDGVAGGKPTGVPEVADSRADQETQDSLRLQHESENAMAAAGYRVELQPTVRPEDGTDQEKKPDMRVGGNITDVVAPISSNAEQVRRAMSEKVSEQQAFRIVLNLGRTSVTREQITTLLERKPIAGLRELFVHDRDGSINRVFPDPALIAPSRK